MDEPTTVHPVRVWLLYGGAWLLATVIFVRVADSPEIRVAHGVLTYLLLIIGASRQGGRALSAMMVLLGYLAVDYLFVPPRRAFGSATELDWLILVGFVLTGVLVTTLFDQLQRAVRVARDRTLEVERLSAERLQLEREAATARVLGEANRLKNALIGSVAHDLRTPVATLTLLADPVAGVAPPQALQRVGQEALRLGEYLSTLQRVATSSGGDPLRLAAYEPTALVQIAVRSGEALLADRAVRMHGASGDLRAWCDETLAVQVLGNLLQNAARYSPPSTAIDVACTADARSVEIVVADRGPGLADHDVERLFTPLRREPTDWSAPLDDETRMGMGLSIARTFARAQRGDVTYRPREGGGACFTLRLPRAPAATSGSPPAPASAPAAAS